MKTLKKLGVPPMPWTVKYTDHEGMVQFADLIMDATGNCVATVLPYDNHPSPSTRLMAAAPDLYEALRLFVETFAAAGIEMIIRDNPHFAGDPFIVAYNRGKVVLEKAGGAE